MARSNTQDKDKAPEPTEETVKTPKPREAFDALTEPDTPAPAFVYNAISDAVDLIDAKAEVQARLQQARDFLNYAVESEQATDEQAAWVKQYLPKRTRSSNGAQAQEQEQPAETATQEA